MLKDKLRNIGYPFKETEKGLLNPISKVLQNAKSKLLNLLSTNKGQRILSNNVQFGIDINKILFQNINYDDAESKIQKQLISSINKWIPQIKIVKVNITTEQHMLIFQINISVNQQDFTSIVMEIQNE